MQSKAKINKRHFRKRLYERFGMESSQDFQRHAVALIRTTSGKFAVEKQSLTRTLYKIPYQEKSFFVVYDNKHKTLVTVLTEQQGQKHL